MKEQGCLVDCVYCKYVHPEYLGTTECPYCQGKTPFFQEARMMDLQTLNQAILSDIFPELYTTENQEQINFLLHILKKIEIHQFDLKTAIIQYIKILEPQKD